MTLMKATITHCFCRCMFVWILVADVVFVLWFCNAKHKVADICIHQAGVNLRHSVITESQIDTD